MRFQILLALAIALITGQACAQVSLPLTHLAVNSAFGNRRHPVTGVYAFHAGVDLKAEHDTVFDVLDGLVSAAGYNPYLGIYIKIYSGPFTISYGHLSRIFVNKGDTLAAGAPIGITGATGRVTGEHLHFAVQFYSHYIDPLAFLSTAQQNQ